MYSTCPSTNPCAIRLFDDTVDELLRYACIVAAPPSVTAQREDPEHSIGLLQAPDPARVDVDLNLADQLVRGMHTEQLTHEQRLEHQGRLGRCTPVIRVIQRRGQLVYEGKIDHCIDLAARLIPQKQANEHPHIEGGPGPNHSAGHIESNPAG